jgi:NitT/TauT family transport system substrate-binding protein
MHSNEPESFSTGIFKRILLGLAAIVLASVGLTACSTSGATDQSTLRLGYFANLTHALPILGVSNGQIQAALGSTKLNAQVFNAGPAAIEALNGGAIDAAFVGPNPALNGWAQSGGTSLRIISGTTSGGAQFVVQPAIAADPASLKGKTFATPQLGNTQDVALRYWLKQKGLSAPKEGGGDVNVVPQENAQTLELFKQGKIDGGWLPEPWASRLVQEAGAKVLVNEASTWPKGEFVTTHLIVSQKFLQDHPDQVKALLTGLVNTLDTIEANPAKARTQVSAELTKLTGKALADTALSRAWDNLTITLDPIAASLQADLDHAVAAGISKPAELKGIYDLTILNSILTAHGKAPVSAGGLGTE